MKTLQEIKMEAIVSTYKELKNMTKTAVALGIGLRTVIRYLDKAGVVRRQK